MSTVYKLQYKETISKQQAKDKICAHAIFGKHGKPVRPQSVKEVKEYFLHKAIDTNKLIEECRNYKNPVPDFENLVRSTWHTSGSGGVGLVDNYNGETIFEMKEPGLFIWSNYEAHFEAACNARDRAVKENSYSAFQECLSQAFASLDAFLNTQAIAWNKQHPTDQLIDSKSHRVNIEDKIGIWVPKISGGKQLEKAGQVWNDFKVLKKIRDDNAIHPKLPGQGVPYSEFASQINAFRLGIAQLLGNLHCLLGLAVPSVIINAIYMPDVEVVEVTE